MKNPKRMRNIVIASFLSVPILASLISTLHLVNFFYLGNHSWMSYVLAVTFEVGSIASFVSLGILKKIKKWAVYTIFTILFMMQLIGNVYFTFEYVNEMLAQDPAWLNSFIEMTRPVYDSESISDYKFVLSLLIGVAIPLVSILFLKSLVDYLSLDDDNPTETIPVIETPVIETIPVIETPVVENKQDDTHIDDSINQFEEIRSQFVESPIEDSIEFIEPAIIEPLENQETILPLEPSRDLPNDFDAALYQNNN